MPVLSTNLKNKTPGTLWRLLIRAAYVRGPLAVGFALSKINVPCSGEVTVHDEHCEGGRRTQSREKYTPLYSFWKVSGSSTHNQTN